MAAFRYAAKRLGGRALQRPQAMITHMGGARAAAEEEQRRLLLGFGPRAIGSPSSDRLRQFSSSPTAQSSTSSTTKHPLPSEKSAAWPREDLVNHIKQIEEKKEDLFYMLAQVDSTYPSFGKIARDNRKLIYMLFGHVDAKPDDPLWSMYQRRKRLYTCLRIGVPMLCAVGLVAYHKGMLG